MREIQTVSPKSKKSDFDPMGDFVKHVFSPTPKGVKRQREREDRVRYVLQDYPGMEKLSPEKILKFAQLNNISIDQIGKRILDPLEKLKKSDEKHYQKTVRKFKESGSGGILLFIIIGIVLWFWLSGK